MNEPWEYGQGVGYGGEGLGGERHGAEGQGTKGAGRGGGRGDTSVSYVRRRGGAGERDMEALYRRAGLHSSGDFDTERTPTDMRRSTRIDRGHGLPASDPDDPGYGYRRFGEGYYGGGAQEERPKDRDFGNESRTGRGATTNEWDERALEGSRGADFEDEYRRWRSATLDIHDRHYFAWRNELARRYDEDYERRRRERFARDADDGRGQRPDQPRGQPQAGQSQEPGRQSGRKRQARQGPHTMAEMTRGTSVGTAQQSASQWATRQRGADQRAPGSRVSPSAPDTQRRKAASKASKSKRK